MGCSSSKPRSNWAEFVDSNEGECQDNTKESGVAVEISENFKRRITKWELESRKQALQMRNFEIEAGRVEETRVNEDVKFIPRISRSRTAAYSSKLSHRGCSMKDISKVKGIFTKSAHVRKSETNEKTFISDYEEHELEAEKFRTKHKETVTLNRISDESVDSHINSAASKSHRSSQIYNAKESLNLMSKNDKESQCSKKEFITLNASSEKCAEIRNFSISHIKHPAKNSKHLLHRKSIEKNYSLHSSQIVDKPQVQRLCSSLMNTSELASTIQRLEENLAYTCDQIQLMSSIESVLESSDNISSENSTFRFTNNPYFSQFIPGVIDPKKMESYQKLIAGILKKDNLKYLQLFSSSLDDVFAMLLAEEIGKSKLSLLESLHLESNLLSDRGISAILKACDNFENVPCLKVIKLANQKAIGTNSESTAINLLRNNSNIVKLTLDFRRKFDISEANNLLARNASLIDRKVKK